MPRLTGTYEYIRAFPRIESTHAHTHLRAHAYTPDIAYHAWPVSDTHTYTNTHTVCICSSHSTQLCQDRRGHLQGSPIVAHWRHLAARRQGPSAISDACIACIPGPEHLTRVPHLTSELDVFKGSSCRQPQRCVLIHASKQANRILRRTNNSQRGALAAS